MAHQIWKVPSSGGEAVQVTHNGGYVAFESTDGVHVYYTQTANSPTSLWRISTRGGEPVKVLEGVIRRAFTVLETGVYYIEATEHEAALPMLGIPGAALPRKAPGGFGSSILPLARPGSSLTSVQGSGKASQRPRMVARFSSPE